MSRTKSVVKHRYFKGERAQRGAGEYTRYVEYREGKDREQGGREFFTGDRENIKGAEVRELWREQSGRGPVMHELILSPGLNCVENQEYTRELMEKLERTKGQELQWYAVEHKNTDHHHIHVLIAGTDVEGRQVRIDRNDHKHIKEWGDRYIEREHQLDRYLDREQERLVTSKEYTHDRGDALFSSLFGRDHEDPKRSKSQPDRASDREKPAPEKQPEKLKEWDKAKAAAELPDKEKIYRDNEGFSKYSSLDELKRLEKGLESRELERVTKQEYAQLKQWIKEKERHGEDYHERKDRAKFDKNERDKQRRKEKKLEEKQNAREAGREFNELDKKYREPFQERSSGVISRRMGRQQRIYEHRGRLSDAHTGYQLNQDRQRMQAVKDAIERDPGNREQYEKELEWLNEAYREQMKEFERLDLSDLLGDKDRERDQRGKDKKDDKERGEQEKDEGSKDHARETDESRTQQEIPATDESEKPDQEKQQDKEREDREQKEPERERDRDDEGRGR